MAKSPKKGGPVRKPNPAENSETEESALLREARERYDSATTAEIENREQGLEDLEFVAGNHWPDEIKRQRVEDNRPVLTINRMPQFVRQVTGDVRQNRPAINVVPADDVSDDDLAKVYSGLIRQIEYASDASIAYETAIEGAAQCGIGHFMITTEYADDDAFEQNIVIRRIRDHFSVTWDPYAIEPTRKDARYCFVEESIDQATFKARYPDVPAESWDFNSVNTNITGDWITTQAIRVAEYWTVNKVQRTIALLDDGGVVDITDLDPDEMGIYTDEDGVPLAISAERKVWRNQVEMRIINGAAVLEGPFMWPGRYIPVVPVLGEEIHMPHNRTIRYGVIRFAKDAQRMYNFWRSAQTEKIALEPKSPWLVTPGNIEGLEHIWRSANTRNVPYLPYIPDPDNKNAVPQRQFPQQQSAAMAQEAMIAAEDMKGAIGIYDAGLGAKSNETSGRAIRQRQMESDTSTVTYPSNLARAIRHAGRILVDLIPKIYDTERVIRVLNEDESTDLVPINRTIVGEDGQERRINDLAAGKYDVIVNTGPSFSTRRQEAVEGVMRLVDAMPEVGALVADILVRNLDWPGADEIAERLRRALPPGIAEKRDGEEPVEPPPPDPEVLLKMAEEKRKAAETAAEVQKTAAETEQIKVETMQTAIETALANGGIERIVAQKVEETITAMLAQSLAGPGGAGQPGG